MKLAIVGVGNVGEAFARAAVGAGHDVTLAASRPANARRVAGEVGAQPADSVPEAAAGADAVVLAVPYREAGDLVRQLADGTTIIDVTNPVSDGGDDLVARPSAAEELQGAAPGAKVVKAFNTIFASRLGAFYAGDDDAAKGMVADLGRSLGYRPIDAGGLRMARSLEEMALLNISLNARNGWSWQSGWKLVGPTG